MPLFIADSSSFSVPKSPNVDVYVGPGKRHFNVSRKLLSSNSKYFEQLLNEQFAEEPEAKVYLETEEPDTFEHLLNWMQQGIISLYFLEQFILARAYDEEALGDNCHSFCDLYCLYTKLKVVRNGREITDKICNILLQGRNVPLQLRTVRKVLWELPEDSTMLEHILQMVANDLVEPWGRGYDYYAELLEGPNAIPGLVRALFKRIKEPRPVGTKFSST